MGTSQMDGSSEHNSTAQVQEWLDRVRRGDKSARDELIAGTMERLAKLARKMLRSFPSVSEFDRTDDVLQNALVRIWTMLDDFVPETPADYFRIAAKQLRRVLIDLARHHTGPMSFGANLARVGPDPPDPSQSTYQPANLALWTEFHRAVELLPAEEREAFDLHFYQGLSHDEAAKVAGVSERTMKRRWATAGVRLSDAMGGQLPGV